MNGRLIERDRLSVAEQAEMLALMQAHFEGVSREQFAADLAGKNWVILLENDVGRIRGFSTLQVYTTQMAGEPLRVVYSGDTIVERTAWGSSGLARTWIGAVHQLRGLDGRRCFWLLITSGFRTYRFLPVFWREFWPRFDAPAAPPILPALARQQFGRRYDAATGIVRFEQPQLLREELRAIPAGRLADPHVAFFAARNPGWCRGDELACLCELSDANLTPAGRRVVAAAEREPADAPCVLA